MTHVDSFYAHKTEREHKRMMRLIKIKNSALLTG